MTAIPLKGVAKGNAQRAYATAKRRNPALPAWSSGYFNELYMAAEDRGINADILVAQWDLETDSGRDTDWTENKNPAGMGIFPDGSTQGLTFTPEIAAYAQVTHMCCYVGITPPANWIALDARWEAAIDAGYFGTVTTIDDLGNGRWATDTGYAAKLAGRYASYWGAYVPTKPAGATTVATLNFDPKLAPLPKHNVIFAWNKVQGVGMDYLGRRTFRGNTFHRCLSDGQTFRNAIDWLLRSTTAGLADAFIDHRTGEMTFINPMRALADTFDFDIPANWSDMAGWTNGPYQAWVASDDAKAFVGAYGGRLGANIINQDLENFEITGDYEDPISDACKETIIQFMCNRAQVLKIPYSSWPINPATGLTVIYGHREWCGTDYKLCPGIVVWTWMNGEMIGLVQDRLKKIQTSGAVVTPPPVKPNKPTYAAPTIPEWITNWDGRAVISDVPNVEDGLVYATTSQYVAIRDTPRYKVADTRNTQRTGAVIKAGEDFNVSFVFTARDGKQWGVTPYGTRVLLADLKIVGDDALKAA